MICNMDCLHCVHPDCINDADDPRIHKSEYMRQYYKAHPERRKADNVRQMKKYYERKASGMCVKCGKHPAEAGVRCRKCAKIQRAANRRYDAAHPRHRIVKNVNECKFCHNPQEPGYKVCPACHEKLKERAKLGAAAMRRVWTWTS